jgi:antibiotic biosynthesis monooxygenase (ABM) superfamily enzyme
MGPLIRHLSMMVWFLLGSGASKKMMTYFMRFSAQPMLTKLSYSLVKDEHRTGLKQPA